MRAASTVTSGGARAGEATKSSEGLPTSLRASQRKGFSKLYCWGGGSVGLVLDLGAAGEKGGGGEDPSLLQPEQARARKIGLTFDLAEISKY